MTAEGHIQTLVSIMPVPHTPVLIQQQGEVLLSVSYDCIGQNLGDYRVYGFRP